jgi:hypothetical protein
MSSFGNPIHATRYFPNHPTNAIACIEIIREQPHADYFLETKLVIYGTPHLGTRILTLLHSNPLDMAQTNIIKIF